MLNGDSARFVGEQADLWEEAQSCGVCEADTWEPASEVCGRRIGRCAKCGTHRLVDRGAEGQLHLLYGHYYTSADPDAAKLKTQLRNPTFAHRRRRLEAAVGSRQRRFFEIGCGDGNYLASCRRAGWDVAGSEFSEETVALIRTPSRYLGHDGQRADSRLRRVPAIPSWVRSMCSSIYITRSNGFTRWGGCSNRQGSSTYRCRTTVR